MSGFVAEWEGLPVQRQLALHLMSRIRSGEYPPGGNLPTYRQLVKDYGVAMNTIREAVRILRYEGYVRTNRGAPAVVCADLPSEDRPACRYCLLAVWVWVSDSDESIGSCRRHVVRAIEELAPQAGGLRITVPVAEAPADEAVRQ